MSAEPRCPSCRALVSPGSDWCGQCYQPIGSSSADAPSTSRTLPWESEEARAWDPLGQLPSPTGRNDANEGGGESAFPVPPADQPGWNPAGEGPLEQPRLEGLKDEAGRPEPSWPCPVCAFRNPIELDACAACGAPFAKLFEDPRKGPAVTPSDAIRRSLLLPGLGHVKVGRTAEGWARAVTFCWTLVTALLLIVSRPAGGGPALVLPMIVVFAAASAAMYVIAAIDAGRAAEGRSPVIGARTLLYGIAALMILSVVALLVLVTQVSPDSIQPRSPTPLAPLQ